MANISTPKEVWKDVVGYEGAYIVSNHGRVKSIPRRNRRTELVLSQYISSSGYAMTGLSLDGVFKNRPVHRLVAEAFIPNPLDLPEVNHIDGDKTNNALDNLEWCSTSQNILHSICALGDERLPKLSTKDVEEIRKSSLPYKELAKAYSVSYATISNVKNFKTHNAPALLGRDAGYWSITELVREFQISRSAISDLLNAEVDPMPGIYERRQWRIHIDDFLTCILVQDESLRMYREPIKRARLFQQRRR